MAHISVIIPCYNAANWIAETIQSVLAQDCTPLEIIVVDDGSSDESAKIVAGKFPGVTLVKTKNGGPSRARNIGTELAQGEFIQYLDADDLLAPGKLGKQLAVLQETGADVVYGSWQKLYSAGGQAGKPGEIIDRVLHDDEIDLFLADFWCPPAAYLFTRRIVEKVGGWNKSLPIIQDARFALDCALQGGAFAPCAGLAAYYRIHSAESVSRRDPIAFKRDCLTNALQVEEWWRQHGGITGKRRQALINVFGSLAHGSFEHDKETFETAYQAVLRHQPDYVPAGPVTLALLSRLIGYRRSQHVAVGYRRLKRALGRGAEGAGEAAR